jgi:hypothetical protein
VTGNLHKIVVDMVMRITHNVGNKRVSFPDSSMVELSAVNRTVVGSSPTQGAKV